MTDPKLDAATEWGPAITVDPARMGGKPCVAGNLDDMMDAAAEPSLEAMRAAFEKIEKRIRMEFAEEIIEKSFTILHVGNTLPSISMTKSSLRRLANPGKEGE